MSEEEAPRDREVELSVVAQVDLEQVESVEQPVLQVRTEVQVQGAPKVAQVEAQQALALPVQQSAD